MASSRIDEDHNYKALSGIDDELRIVMVGKTGVGKSALGNSLLQKPHFESSTTGISVTANCAFARGKLRDGTNFLIVDTPGIFDTRTSDMETTTELVECIMMSAPGPHVFLFVLSISNRFTKEELYTLNNLVVVFGEDVINHVVIVFNGKDSLMHEKITLADYLKKVPPELSKLVQRCGSRCATINNRADQAEVQADVDIIINEVRRTIQENGGSYYTNDMYKAAAEAKRLLDEEEYRKIIESQEKRDELQMQVVMAMMSDLVDTRKHVGDEFMQKALDAALSLNEQHKQKLLERIGKLKVEFVQFTNCRRKTITTLSELAKELNESKESVRISKVTSSVGGIVSTGLTVAGLCNILIPGVGTGLFVAGIGLGALSGVTGVGATIFDRVVSKKMQERCNKILEEDNQAALKFQTALDACITVIIHKITPYNRNALAAGIQLCRLADMVADVVAPGIKGAGAFVKGMPIAGAVFSMITLPLDIEDLISNYIDIQKSTPHQISEKITEVANKLQDELEQLQLRHKRIESIGNALPIEVPKQLQD